MYIIILRNFTQNVLTLIFVLGINLVHGQQDLNMNVVVEGKVIENLKNGDSLFFTNGGLNEKYFQTKFIGSEVTEREFKFKNALPYPHLFFLNLKSERNQIAQRGGFYFFDGTTNHIEIDPIGECSSVNGKTHKEFTEKFIPFIFQEINYDCNEFHFSKLFHWEKNSFDKKLVEYIKQNPESYVGLWFLITQFETHGYSDLYQNTLKSFSPAMQQTELWQSAQNQLDKIRIRKNEKFPEWELKTTALKTKKIALPQAQYTLVDFWFSSCRPCLAAFPDLKKLYNKYQSRGFEIISISVDKTQDIEKWKKVIRDRDLVWNHYLDENAKEADQEKINAFPTTFLLNEKGEVIKKNISLTELEVLLKENI